VSGPVIDPRHDIVERLEQSGIRYYVTGSEAMAAHGLGYRLTNDIDVVLDIEPGAYDVVVRPFFEPAYIVNALLPTARRWLGSAIAIATVSKVDFVIRVRDPWGQAALARRLRIDDPALGDAWIATLEDVLLAKLEWAEGDLASLQGKDIHRIIEAVPSLDRSYLDLQAAGLGLRDALDRAFA
jgi:hypothetical protein